MLDLESWNNAVVHLVVEEGSTNEMLAFVEELINFEQAFIWGLLQFYNFVFQLFLRVPLDHKVVQLFENLLTIVDGTEHIKYLVSNIEHELAPYQHFQTNISWDVFRLLHYPIKHLPEAHLNINSFQGRKSFIKHLSQFFYVVEFSLAVPQQVDAVRYLLSSQNTRVLLKIENDTF